MEYKVKVEFEYPIGDVKILASKGEKGDRGERGEPGPRGATGATGPANTLSIGTVTKGDNASASITGDAPNQTLNLILPKGDKGDTGSQGETGETGATGNGIASTVLNADYTLTITYTDGTSYTTPSIRGATGPAGTIDWASMKYTVSGTTDGSGFLSVPHNIVSPSTGIIVATRLKSITTGGGDLGAAYVDVLTNYNDAQTHDLYALRLKNWNDTAWASKAVEVDIFYALVS